MDGIVQPSAGFLEMIMGPMWSGKTSRLLDLHAQYSLCGVPVIAINYAGDAERGIETGMVRTHDGREAGCYSARRLGHVPAKAVAAAAAVLVNETQFFPDALEWITNAVEEDGKRVHAAGLDADYLRRPFGNWLGLIPLADELVKKKAFCRSCRVRHASFSHRVVADNRVQLIGAEDAYHPLCRGCYRHATMNCQ